MFRWAALVLALSAGPAPAEIDADSRDRGLERIAALPGIDRLLASCPADIHDILPLRLLPGDWSLEACRDDLPACLDACLLRGGDEACFQAALIYQDGSSDAERLASRRLFALSCAQGRQGACINRAANIRNSPLAGDILSRISRDKTESCTFRSFSAGCDAGVAWGCAMTAQAYERGEGTQADRAAAEADYRRACDLLAADDQDHPACRFARDGLARLAR